MKTKTEEFEEWLAGFCYFISEKTIGKTPHDIFNSVDMFSAKLAFMSGNSYEEAQDNIINM